MASSWLPDQDSPLLAFTQQFATKLSATPTAYNCTAGQATALAALVTSYASALALALDPHTRGTSTIFAKQQAKKLLVAEIRALARQVQGSQNVTDQQRQDLGLPVKVGPSPIPIPQVQPVMDIVSVVGRTVKVRLHQPATERRAKPKGVAGAYVFSFIGTTPPTDPSGFDFEGASTRGTFDVTFPASVAPGTQVWLTAAWYNPRNQLGPACDAIPVHLQYGTTVAV